MSYADELANHSFKGNVIVRINGGAYYGRHQPDSGLSVPAAQRILDKFSINPQVVSLENAKTTFGSVTFSLIDKDNIITALFDNNLNLFMGQEVEIWLGRMTGSFAWADYLQLQTFKISKVSFKGEAFEFTAQEITADFQKAVFNTQALLNADTVAGAATLVASSSIADFPASGRLFIDDEFKNYTSKNDGTKTFTLSGTTANAHSQGATIYNVTTVTAENPIEILLRILQSTGGGTWDDYAEGLGVVDADLDLTAMTAIRDATFSGEAFTFELYGIDNILEFIEDEILKPCSIRFIVSENNKLSLAVLDGAIFVESPTLIDETVIDPKSVTYEVDSTGVRNVVEFRYGYEHETDMFTAVYTEENAESIANYGRRDPLIIESKGVPSGAGGLAIATERAGRMLGRFSNATPKISVSTFFEHSLVLIGERILLSYPLPTEVGDRVFSKELEVIKKTVDEGKGMVKLDLAFTSYSGLREGYISPSPLCVTGLGGSSAYTLNESDGFNVGDVVCFTLNGTRNATYPDAYQIYSISTSSPTYDSFRFEGLLGSFVAAAVNGYHIQFANYDETAYSTGASNSAAQRRYAFATTADFSDGTRPYQITF